MSVRERSRKRKYLSNLWLRQLPSYQEIAKADLNLFLYNTVLMCPRHLSVSSDSGKLEATPSVEANNIRFCRPDGVFVFVFLH